MTDEFLRDRFLYDLKNLEDTKLEVVVVAVRLPSGAIEIITNTKQLESKLEYYKTAYDKRFRLINNPEVQIVGYLIV